MKKILIDDVVDVISGDSGLVYKGKRYYSCKCGGYKGLVKEVIKERVERIWKEFNVGKNEIYVKEGMFDYGNYVVGNRWVDNKLMIGCDFMKELKKIENFERLKKIFE